MPPPDLHRFIVRSLGAMEREAPGSYGRLCASLSGQRIGVEGDGQRFALRFERHEVTSTAACGGEDVLVAVDCRTILALVDGHVTLEGALRQDRLQVRGSVASAARAFDGLQAYLRGAVRCPSFPSLLSELRYAEGGEERFP